MYHTLLPSTCLLCTSPTDQPDNVCFRCQQDLPILPDHCPQCAQFLSVCHRCSTQPPPFDRTYALFPYEPPIIALIIQLKFQHQLHLARAMGEWLSCRLKRWYHQQPLPDLILPIPLHPRRLRERGFNQALEIARPIARAFKLPIDTTGMKRIKHTRTQSALPAAERQSNLADAFTATRDYSGLHIAVLDDVITTGRTVTECCKLLKQHGAKRIDVWCCARRG